MSLYYEGESEQFDRDRMVRDARSRARLRRARRLLDEAEERRDVAFLADGGLSIAVIAGHTMLTRRRVSKHLEAWTHVKADDGLARDERARQAIATAVLDDPLDDSVVNKLLTRLSLLAVAEGAEGAEAGATAIRDGIEWQLRQLERGHEDGLLEKTQVRSIGTLARRNVEATQQTAGPCSKTAVTRRT